MELITQQAMRAGFTGGVVVDYPNSTKAKKYVNPHWLQHPPSHMPRLPHRMFLCLFTGGAPAQLPKVGMPLVINSLVLVHVTQLTSI